MVKNLKGSDIILNLEEIRIANLDGYSSSSCTGNAAFYFDCETKHGYCEDPKFMGTIKILKVSKEKDKVYTLKVRFDYEEEDW